jgi:uncharacterized phage protein (TIGR01671 family)
MREIKFRAWDVCHKKMHEVTSINWMSRAVWFKGYPVKHVGNLGEQCTVLMQSIDLVDKAGTMIYEGDIIDCGVSDLRSGEHLLCVVAWFAPGFAFRRLDGSFSTAGPLLSFNNSTMLKIIGNIYENKPAAK